MGYEESRRKIFSYHRPEEPPPPEEADLQRAPAGNFDGTGPASISSRTATTEQIKNISQRVKAFFGRTINANYAL